MTGQLAAIWWRCSTKGRQLEISPETQTHEAKRVLEAKGYAVPDEYILGSDWTSMDLMGCPQFQELRRLVDERKVKAVGILDRDRLQAKGLQRLVFMSECKERGVEIVVAHGPEFVDGPEGQIVELALAVGKERANLRAQMGSRMGLRDRVLLKGLPVTRKASFGYAFNKVMDTLEPTPDLAVVDRIFRWLLEGVSLRQISKRLFGMGMPSPSGKATWSITTLSRIVGDPVYAGRYYALRTEAAEPKRRKGNTYGKSGQRRKAQEEWTHVPTIKVVDPPITWAEHLEIKQRLDRNRLYSRRNAKRQYLLRGMIRCEVHSKVYHGFKYHRVWGYRCTELVTTNWDSEHCLRRVLHGPQIEEAIWAEVTRLLMNPDLIQKEAARVRKGESMTVEALERAEREAEKKLRASYDAEAHYARLSAQGKLSDETLSRLLAETKAQRTWSREELMRIERGKAALQTGAEAANNLGKLLGRVKGRLDTATWEERRMVLEALDTQLKVIEDGKLDLHLYAPSDMSVASRSPAHG